MKGISKISLTLVAAAAGQGGSSISRRKLDESVQALTRGLLRAHDTRNCRIRSDKNAVACVRG